jgi:hypothetical protein
VSSVRWFGHSAIALNITFISYDDNIDFGIMACRQTVPDVQHLGDYLEQSLAELEDSV